MTYNPQFTEGKEYKLPKVSKTTDLFGENHKNGVYKHYERDTSKRYPYNIIQFNMDKPKVHPTQKPIELLEYFPSFSSEMICPVRAFIFKVTCNMLMQGHQVKERIFKPLPFHGLILLHKLVSGLFQFVTL